MNATSSGAAYNILTTLELCGRLPSSSAIENEGYKAKANGVTLHGNTKESKSDLLRFVAETCCSGDNLFIEEKVDKHEEKSIVGESELEEVHVPKFFSQSQTFQALLESSAEALKADPSEQYTRRVILDVLAQAMKLTTLQADPTDSKTQALMLDVMEQSSQFVAQNIAVPQFNTKDVGDRTLVFNVYSRLAKLLGRNTPDAIKADIRGMLNAAGDEIKYTNSPGRKPKASAQQQDKSNLQGPELHIDQIIQPLLDDDMKPYMYEMSNYYIDPLKNFYSVLSKWRSEGRLVKIWTDK